MKKILLTGGTGFIGRNIIEQLTTKYKIYAPDRRELNIIDQNSVDNYLKNKIFDIVIHCAILNPSRNNEDLKENILDYTMRGLLNLKKHEKDFEKIIYIGSGAEYDKSQNIINVKENDIGRFIPKDSYGYAKYILNQIAKNSYNIYNLRIFGCYGKYEQERRLIRSVINQSLNCDIINLVQDCYFSYVSVNDLIRVIDWVINNKPKYHDYNVCNKSKYLLSDIAKLVKKKISTKNSIIIEHDGLNKEYSGNSDRLFQELPIKFDETLEIGIDKEIEWLKEGIK